jgi:hypothetical protein
VVGYRVHAVQILSSFMHVDEKRFELAGARRLLQLAQSLGFDLPNAFAGDGKQRPTSSSVCSEPSSRPKRIFMIFSSRGVRVRVSDAFDCTQD